MWRFRITANKDIFCYFRIKEFIDPWLIIQAKISLIKIKIHLFIDGQIMIELKASIWLILTLIFLSLFNKIVGKLFFTSIYLKIIMKNSKCWYLTISSYILFFICKTISSINFFHLFLFIPTSQFVNITNNIIFLNKLGFIIRTF